METEKRSLFLGKEMEGREDGAEQTGAYTEELAAAVSGGRGRETQGVIGGMLAESLQPLRLMGESWETPRTHTQSALAPMSSELVTSREVSRGTSEAVELLPVSAMAFSLIDLCSFSGRASNTFL